MQEALKHTIAEHVKEQVKIGFKLHASVLEDSVVNAVRSRAVTPSPHVIDTQVRYYNNIHKSFHLRARGRRL